MCDTHYQRWRAGKRGADLERPIEPRISTAGVCSVPDCGRRIAKSGMCTVHYKRSLAGESLDTPIRAYRYQGATCSIDGCDNPPHTQTLCGVHWQRLRRHGDALWEPPTMEERFWANVDQSEGDEACWPWTAFLSEQGYGRFAKSHVVSRNAHVVAYELTYGPVPEGFQVDHICHSQARSAGECSGGPSCEHRACQNPRHLEVVSPAEHARRRSEAQRYCKRGHEFTPENTYLYRGMRHCKACGAERQRRRQRRKRSNS